MAEHPADCACKAQKAPEGWSPDSMLEVAAYAFGVIVEQNGDRVQIKQAVSLGGLDFVVVSKLDPQTARHYAETMVKGADIVEGKDVAEESSDVPG